MSRVEHHIGVLKPLPLLDGETLEEQCKRLLELEELPKYASSYEEHMLDVGVYEKDILLQDGKLYKIDSKELSEDEDVIKAKQLPNGDIEFEVRYYNGGCGFAEALVEAIGTIPGQEQKTD